MEGRPIMPEFRLYPALVGSVLWPISLFWYILKVVFLKLLLMKPAGWHGLLAQVFTGPYP
jgi:hypothetical protein